MELEKLIKCLSPVKVYDKKSHTYNEVPCGKCYYCQLAHGTKGSLLLQNEQLKYPYSVFFTLTFSDKFLPITQLRVEDDNLVTLIHPLDYDSNTNFKKTYLLEWLSEKDWSLLFLTVREFGGVPVLSHRIAVIIQRAIRLQYPESRVYIVGEYGPNSLRPHYHGILYFTKLPERASLNEFFNSIWNSNSIYGSESSELLGFITFDITDGASAAKSYIASYLNCFSKLPAYLQSGPFRPFSSRSRDASFGIERFSTSEILQAFFQPSFKVSQFDVISGAQLFAEIPARVFTQFFPRLPKRFAKSYNGVASVMSAFWRYDSFEVFYRELCSLGFSYKLPVLWKNYFGIDDDALNFLDDKIKRRIKHRFYEARSLLNKCRKYNLLPRLYCYLYVNYYSYVELKKLKEWYVHQQQLIKFYDDVSVIDMLYDSGAQPYNSGRSLLDTPAAKRQELVLKRRCLDNTKTKNRNSYNSVHNRSSKFKPILKQL